jgi:hypothetical protein
MGFKGMNHRYKIRMYEAGERNGSLAEGIVVLPIDQSFSLEAVSADDAERILREGVMKGKLATGRVYQICPASGNPETIRSVAIGGEANARRVFLDAAQGLYSVVRRIRYAEAREEREELMALADG